MRLNTSQLLFLVTIGLSSFPILAPLHAYPNVVVNNVTPSPMEGPIHHAQAAGESSPQEKSMRTVWTLAVLPVNGPALMYSGHHFQGSAISLFEAFGIAFLSVGIASGCGSAQDFEDCQLLRGLTIGGGALMWLPGWVYSLVRGPIYVRQHNRKIQERKEALSPWLRIGEKDKKSFGLALRF